MPRTSYALKTFGSSTRGCYWRRVADRRTESSFVYPHKRVTTAFQVAKRGEQSFEQAVHSARRAGGSRRGGERLRGELDVQRSVHQPGRELAGARRRLSRPGDGPGAGHMRAGIDELEPFR